MSPDQRARPVPHPRAAARQRRRRATDGDGMGSQGGSKARIRMRPAPHPRSGSPACPDQVPLRLLRMSTKRRMTQRRVADAGDPCHDLGAILLDDQAFFRQTGGDPESGGVTRAGTTRLAPRGWHHEAGTGGLARSSILASGSASPARFRATVSPRRRWQRGQGSMTRVHFLCHVSQLGGQARADSPGKDDHDTR